MKQLFFFALLFAAFVNTGIAATLKAPVTDENAATTDSVDLFKTEPDAGKSLTLAMAASIVLPGAGHQYLDRNRSAFVYLSAEALSVFAFFFCDHYALKTAQEAAGFAWIHAQASGPIHNADDFHWKLIGNFMDVQEYNNVMDLNRTPQDKITDPSLAWYWDDKSSQDRFNKIRTASRSYRIISNFFIGAMVLNRVVAFIDIRTTSRNKGIKHASLSLDDWTPIVSATPNSLDLALSGSF